MNRLLVLLVASWLAANRQAHAEDPATVTVRGEVIIIEDRLPPKVKPKPKNYVAQKAPPYSDRAVLSDAWTRAWLLLDVSRTGEVMRFKFLKRPGYDLEKIAQAEVFKLRFEPARDASDRPIPSIVVWSIEWPSAGWLEKLVGTRTRMPPLVGVPPHVRLMSEYVPCRGSGPWHMGSVHKTYKDCSTPDLTKAANEAWIEAP